MVIRIKDFRQKKKSEQKTWSVRTHISISFRGKSRYFQAENICQYPIPIGSVFKRPFDQGRVRWPYGEMQKICWQDSLSHIPFGTKNKYICLLCFFFSLSICLSCLRLPVSIFGRLCLARCRRHLCNGSGRR